MKKDSDSDSSLNLNKIQALESKVERVSQEVEWIKRQSNIKPFTFSIIKISALCIFCILACITWFYCCR